MATPRSQLVDESVTPWYHCISRCVRRARLCGEGLEHRKDWIVHRLRELTEIFAVDCGAFAVMDNHLHLLLRLDSRRANEWSDEEVARRWLTLFPLRDLHGRAFALTTRPSQAPKQGNSEPGQTKQARPSQAPKQHTDQARHLSRVIQRLSAVHDAA